MGAIRSDLEAWLSQGRNESHPLATAALALADRLDVGADTSSAMASAVGRLQAVMLELDGARRPAIDGLDLLQVRTAARRAGAMGVVEALPLEVIMQIRASEAARFSQRPIPDDSPTREDRP